MFLFQKNLAEIKPNRLVWNVDQNPARPVIDLPETKKENPNNNQKSETFKPPKSNELETAHREQEKNDPAQKEEMQKIKQQLGIHEIPKELKNLSRAEIRNLERKNPELLFNTCFWKIEENGSLTPIEKPEELKAGENIQFSVEDAGTKNKHLEMGAGLRTLPEKFNVVRIGKEKFYRIYSGGPFVDAAGDYRAVRTHEKEIITLTDESVPVEIKNGIKKRSSDYHATDAANLISEFAKNAEDLSSAEFKEKIEKARAENPELIDYLNVSKEDLARLQLGEKGSRSMRNNNPGNLKFIGQAGAIGADEKNFARFATLEAGVAAHKNQIRIDAKRDFTVLEFTQKYLGMTPGGKTTSTAEGDALAYARAISDNPNVKLKDLNINAIQKAMQKYESWEGPENLKS
ncbi:MAG: hypothetical protein ABIE14_03810 [Patescibacteria group bacterium]